MASPNGTAREPMLPVPYRVTSRQAETHDSVTLRLDPVGERLGLHHLEKEPLTLEHAAHIVRMLQQVR